MNNSNSIDEPDLMRWGLRDFDTPRLSNRYEDSLGYDFVHFVFGDYFAPPFYPLLMVFTCVVCGIIALFFALTTISLILEVLDTLKLKIVAQRIPEKLDRAVTVFVFEGMNKPSKDSQNPHYTKELIKNNNKKSFKDDAFLDDTIAEMTEIGIAKRKRIKYKNEQYHTKKEISKRVQEIKDKSTVINLPVKDFKKYKKLYPEGHFAVFSDELLLNFDENEKQELKSKLSQLKETRKNYLNDLNNKNNADREVLQVIDDKIKDYKEELSSKSVSILDEIKERLENEFNNFEEKKNDSDKELTLNTLKKALNY